MPTYLVLLPSLVASPGGIQRYDVDLVQALAAAGVDCSVITLNDLPRVPIPGLDPRIRVWGCGGGARAIAKARFVLTAVRRCLSARPARIVGGHVHFALLAVFLRIIARVPLVVVVYGIEVWSGLGPLTRWALRRAEQIWAISRFTRERVIATAMVDESRVQVVPNSVDGDRFRPRLRDQRLSAQHDLDDSWVVMTVGRLNLSERDKGHAVVLRALRRLKDTVPNVKYLIVGEGEYRGLLEREAADLGVRNDTVFAGAVTEEDLPLYYSLCDVFVMPSKKEGFGFVFLEALASGKPVIAGHRDGSRDALLDGEIGQLVDPDDDDAVAQAILAVLTKEAPADVRDPGRLRQRVLECYGRSAFLSRVQRLVGEPCP